MTLTIFIYLKWNYKLLLSFEYHANNLGIIWEEVVVLISKLDSRSNHILLFYFCCKQLRLCSEAIFYFHFLHWLDKAQQFFTLRYFSPGGFSQLPSLSFLFFGLSSNNIIILSFTTSQADNSMNILRGFLFSLSF